MPKERVHHGPIYWTSEDGTQGGRYTGDESVPKSILSGITFREEPSLEVSWFKDSHVQVSLHAPREWWDHLMHTYSEQNSPGTHAWGVFTSEMSRAEINDMIRVLRRARDQVFGVDE